MVVLRSSVVSFFTSESAIYRVCDQCSYHVPQLSTQKILQHARLAEAGVIPRDPLKESISLELDMINIL